MSSLNTRASPVLILFNFCPPGWISSWACPNRVFIYPAWASKEQFSLTLCKVRWSKVRDPGLLRSPFFFFWEMGEDVNKTKPKHSWIAKLCALGFQCWLKVQIEQLVGNCRGAQSLYAQVSASLFLKQGKQKKSVGLLREFHQKQKPPF